MGTQTAVGNYCYNKICQTSQCEKKGLNREEAGDRESKRERERERERENWGGGAERV